MGHGIGPRWPVRCSRWGHGDYFVGTDDIEALQSELFVAAQTLPCWRGTTAFTLDQRLRMVEYQDCDIEDPLVENLHLVRDGRAATDANEVAVSLTYAAQHGVNVGDPIEVGVPLDARDVVGAVAGLVPVTAVTVAMENMVWDVSPVPFGILVGAALVSAGAAWLFTPGLRT
ncbi:hypothetical protein [Natronoglycomyces albus]|uniref:Uncharacterized protein n=1 Tax=Natronoglycomyces albus TaxID=2811108 RepID=A0A895XVC0_9ACTN|nr:hypothetical protein [Natronoglycomyces albus]QSB06170.1 hypothetical protein JQS30_04450 [Natronoglycomyces albus]